MGITATRRRGQELDDAILEAGWRVLLVRGYAGFTFEAVAERAGTSKPVLYRRWPAKEQLLIAVLEHRLLESAVATPDTGSLRDDVIAHLRGGNRFGDVAPALFSTFFGAFFDETATTPAQLRALLLGDRGLGMTAIVERAVARGELPPNGLPERVAALPFDLLRQELIMNLAAVPDEVIVDIVDTVFLPLARAQRAAPEHAGDSEAPRA